MLYFLLNEDRSVASVTDYHPDRDVEKFSDAYPSDIVSRNSFHSFAEAEEIAASATDATGAIYVATDAGPYCSPRYDVVRMYEVGEKVSYGFNGDSYPCGEIIHVSESGRVIITSDKASTKRFYRKGLTGSWREGGMWFLGRGHVEKRNPHL